MVVLGVGAEESGTVNKLYYCHFFIIQIGLLMNDIHESGELFFLPANIRLPAVAVL